MASVFSDPQYYWSELREWFSMQLTLDMTKGKIENLDDGDRKVRVYTTGEGNDEPIDALSLREEYKVLKPKMHPAHPLNDNASAFSDPEYLWLERKEWFSVPFKLDMTEKEIQDDNDIPTMFHGTEWGAAFQIVRKRAFIIGQGTHSHHRKKWSGCWCVPTLPDALQRCNPARFLDQMKRPSRWCCPVVLQLKAVKYVRMPHSTMHCAPGDIGTPHNGLVIYQIHFNRRLMRNFKPWRRKPCGDYFWSIQNQNRMCSCGLCGAYTHGTDPDWESWERSNAGKWYQRRCYERVTSSKFTVWF